MRHLITFALLLATWLPEACVAGDVSPDGILEYFPGTWQWMREDGESGTVRWRLIAGDRALAGAGRTSLGGADFGLGGWQSHEKKWVHTWYAENGAYGRMEWTSFDGQTYKGTVRLFEPGEAPIEDAASCEIIDRDHFVLSIAGTSEKWKRVGERKAAGALRDPHLKALDPIVGAWEVSFDWPDLDFEKAFVTYRWTLDGKYLEARWRSPAGEDLGPEIFVWDPVNETIRMWGFDQTAFYEANWDIKGNTWTGKYRGTRLTGDRDKSTIVLTIKDDNTVLGTRYPEGEDEPDGSAKFRRISDKRSSPSRGGGKSRDKGERLSMEIPAQAKTALRYFVGKWRYETYLNDKKTGEGVDRRRWAPGKHCLMMTGSGTEQGETIADSGLCGWNPIDETLVEHWYTTAGLAVTIRYPLAKMTENQWHGSVEAHHPDGTNQAGVCKLTKTDDGFVWVAHWQENGQRMTRKGVASRVSGKKRRP